jgi:hypothetical protein
LVNCIYSCVNNTLFITVPCFQTVEVIISPTLLTSNVTWHIVIFPWWAVTSSSVFFSTFSEKYIKTTAVTFTIWCGGWVGFRFYKIKYQIIMRWNISSSATLPNLWEKEGYDVTFVWLALNGHMIPISTNQWFSENQSLILE